MLVLALVLGLTESTQHVEPAAAGSAGTAVQGPLTADTTWTKTGGPYRLTGNVTVPTGVTLTIEPGVTVQANNGLYLYVVGEIQAVGSAAEPIVFTTAGTSWNGIAFNDDSSHDGVTSSTIRYAVIEKSSGFGIDYHGYAPTVDHNVFRNNRWGIYASYPGATVSIDHNRFEGSTTAAIAGVAADRIDITDNEFAGPNDYISASGNGSRETWNIYNNDFPENPQLSSPNWLGVLQAGPGTYSINATNNWWGTPNATEVENRIYHGYDDPSLPLVNYTPHLAVANNPLRPSAPTGTTATADDRAAMVSWTAPANRGASDLVSYTVTAQPGGAAETVAADQTSVRFHGLTYGTEYTFHVNAKNFFGTGPASPPSAEITPTEATDPAVEIMSPQDGAAYAHATKVDANYSCADNPGGSGIATCTGTVTQGAPIDTSTLGDHDFTVTATDVAGNTTEVTHTYTVTDAQPDALIKKGDTGTYWGDDIYNTTGAGQNVGAYAARGRSVNYFVTVQNDAAFADRIVLRGTPSNIRFQVKYTTSGNGITNGITSGTYLTPTLAPGDTFTVKVTVTVRTTAPAGSSLTGALTATSNADRTTKDNVKFVTRRS